MRDSFSMESGTGRVRISKLAIIICGLVHSDPPLVSTSAAAASAFATIVRVLSYYCCVRNTAIRMIKHVRLSCTTTLRTKSRTPRIVWGGNTGA